MTDGPSGMGKPHPPLFVAPSSAVAARERAVNWLLSLRVFGCLPDTNAWGCTEAGVRKASREETAGEFAPTLVSVYGEFVAAA